METRLLHLIPLFPFAGALTLFLFGRGMRRPNVHLVAITAIAGAFIATVLAFSRLHEAAHATGLTDHVWTWFSSGSLKVDVTLRMDALSGVMCLIITFIGTLIHIYSTGYMSHEKDHARFFSYLNLFCGAMLVLVLGDSLPVMFVGWEGVGLCSYLLIGFWYDVKANADAGKKAFITNRVGDFGFLLGMFLIFQAVGTLDIPSVNGAAAAFTAPLWGQTIGFWAALFLFIGACGKSAQIPLYVWLPDAMAGPTPVSALIHAATMVTAGVYMVARMHALFMVAPLALAIVALVGALTALFAAIIGFAQNDFKKVLAYSTVSQLGFMFVGVGTANFGSGVFHLMTHAFFKAGLFLCAGSVMHAMSGSGDITKMGGLKKLTPWTHGVFLVCWLAICGVPPFSGFFSKDAIVAGAFATHAFEGTSVPWMGSVVGVMLLAAALCTAFYMSRLYFLVFSGESRADDETKRHIHESPMEMVGPLVVLAGGALLSGFLGVPGSRNWLAHWLEPSVGPELHIAPMTEYALMAVSTGVAALGIVLAFVFYGGGYRDPAIRFAQSMPGFVQLVRDKFRVDEMYAFLITWLVKRPARLLFWVVDRFLIDKVLVHGSAAVVDVAGRLTRSLQTGDSQRYLAGFAIGVAALVYIATRPPQPHELRLKVEGTIVEADVGTGAVGGDILYEFDFDGDGKADRSGKTPVQRFVYEGSGRYTITAVVRDTKWDTSTTLVKKVTVK